MSIARDPDKDGFKSLTLLREEFDAKKTCELDGCCNPLTNRLGPNWKHLCREHQLEQTQYGGMGTFARPWTFFRGWVCSCCGYDPRTDKRFDNVEFDSTMHKLRTMRSMIVGAHIIRRADGGRDTADNVRGLCKLCDSFLTGLHNDHLAGTRIDLL